MAEITPLARQSRNSATVVQTLNRPFEARSIHIRWPALASAMGWAVLWSISAGKGSAKGGFSIAVM